MKNNVASSVQLKHSGTILVVVGMITVFASLRSNLFLYNGTYNLYLIAGLVLEFIGVLMLIKYYFNNDRKGFFIRIYAVLVIVAALIGYYVFYISRI